MEFVVFSCAMNITELAITIARLHLGHTSFAALCMSCDTNGLCMTDAAYAIKVTPSNMTEIVNRLVRLEYVTRDTDPKDRRRYLIYATPAGRDLVKSVVDELGLRPEA
jgi:DNA-binding MarR family transcriptional regulator